MSGENLEFLKANTGYDEATIKESHNIFIKECPDGRLTPDNLLDLYEPFFCKGKAEQYCNHVFRTFDRDQNGFIDFEEFVLAMYVSSDGSAKEKLTWAFRMYDVDGSGVIEPNEMVKVVEAIYCMWGDDATEPTTISPKDRAMKIFRRMDANEDGNLTEEEFDLMTMNKAKREKALAKKKSA